MSETKFTPGPWNLICGYDVVTHIGYDDIAEVYTKPEAVDEAEANAHLIAAAPDLYAALHKIGYEPIGDAEASHAEVLRECVAIARAALAKARGEQ